MMENKQTEFGPTGLGAEFLLENAQFEPSPAFTENLNARLRQKVVGFLPDQPSIEKQRIARPAVRAKHSTWQWAISAAVLVCLAFVTLWFTAPPVRAKVAAFFQRFGVQLSVAQEGVVISGFQPLAPEGVPPQMIHFMAHNWCFGALQDGQACNGLSYTELRYFSQDAFIVIYETPDQSDSVLPAGEQTLIGEYEAVLHRDLSGVVRLAQPAPQTWRVDGNSTGSGGGGGGGGGSNDAGPMELPYTGAVELIWNQADVHIELLTNLPLDEALRLAGSMNPAPELNEP